MTWTWSVGQTPADSDLAQDLADGWASREDAEDWLSHTFADLLDEGCSQAVLTDDGTPVYTMDLGADVGTGSATGDRQA